MSARWVAFVVWAMLAASAVFWGLRLWVAPVAVPPGVVPVDGATAAHGDLGLLFGRSLAAAPVELAAPAPSRFKLIGVVSPQQGRDAGVALALISIDDQPAKAYRVGATVDGQTVLQSVRSQGVSLGPRDGAALTLQLPPPAPASTGTLPAVSMQPTPFRGALPPLPSPQPVRLPMPVAAPAEGAVAPQPFGQQQHQ